jgi:hypothetical protein
VSGTGSTQSQEYTIEELLGRKSSSSGPENRDHGRTGSITLNYVIHLYQQKLALTSPTSGGRSVGIVCSRTQATEFVFDRHNNHFVVTHLEAL